MTATKSNNQKNSVDDVAGRLVTDARETNHHTQARCPELRQSWGGRGVRMSLLKLTDVSARSASRLAFKQKKNRDKRTTYREVMLI